MKLNISKWDRIFGKMGKKVHSKRLKSFKLDKFLVKSFVRNGRNIRNLYSIVVNYLVYNFNYSCDEKLFNPVESMQVLLVGNTNSLLDFDILFDGMAFVVQQTQKDPAFLVCCNVNKLEKFEEVNWLSEFQSFFVRVSFIRILRIEWKTHGTDRDSIPPEPFYSKSKSQLKLLDGNEWLGSIDNDEYPRSVKINWVRSDLIGFYQIQLNWVVFNSI